MPVSDRPQIACTPPQLTGSVHREQRVPRRCPPTPHSSPLSTQTLPMRCEECSEYLIFPALPSLDWRQRVGQRAGSRQGWAGPALVPVLVGGAAAGHFSFGSRSGHRCALSGMGSSNIASEWAAEVVSCSLDTMALDTFLGRGARNGNTEWEAKYAEMGQLWHPQARQAYFWAPLSHLWKKPIKTHCMAQKQHNTPSIDPLNS